MTTSAEPPHAADVGPAEVEPDEAGQPQPVEQLPEKKEQPSWKKQLLMGTALALIAAVLGRAVGIIPNPFDDGTPEPSGSIKIGETLANQTRGMFLGTETAPKPNEPFGVTLAVERTSEHTAAHGCRLVWSYIDATVPAPVSEKKLLDQTARDVVGDRSACQGGARIWVPYDPALETYGVVRVRVELFAGDKQLGLPAESEDISF